MEYKDYYKVLGVSREATPEEIKRAYRKKAREFHPDRNKTAGAEARFKEANEANEVLSDAKKRQAYDQLGANWREGQRFAPPPGWQFNFGAAGQRGGDGGPGFSDFFSSLFGGGNPFAGGGFEDLQGGGFATPPQDVRARIAITLEDAFHGAQRTISLSNGRTLSVRIPKGIGAGQTIRLAEQGARGGDLLLEIEFEPHARFRVDGRDIHVDVALAPWEAALGAKVEVPTLGGEVTLTVPAGSHAGRKMRLKGRGLPGRKPSDAAGDQIVTFQIDTPPAESDEQKQFYEEMAQRFAGFIPRR